CPRFCACGVVGRGRAQLRAGGGVGRKPRWLYLREGLKVIDSPHRFVLWVVYVVEGRAFVPNRDALQLSVTPVLKLVEDKKTEAQPLDGLRNRCGALLYAMLCTCIVM